MIDREKILEKRRQLQIQRQKAITKVNDLDTKIHKLWNKAYGIKTKTLKCGCKKEYGGESVLGGPSPDILIVYASCEVHNPYDLKCPKCNKGFNKSQDTYDYSHSYTCPYCKYENIEDTEELD